MVGLASIPVVGFEILREEPIGSSKRALYDHTHIPLVINSQSITCQIQQQIP